MSKKLLFVALVLVVVLGGGILLYLNRGWLIRPDFSKVGGTELVFAVEPAHESFSAAHLVSSLRNRFDPSGSAGVQVEESGEMQVIVRIPNGPEHDALVEIAPALVSMRGNIEFVIVANATDDGPAIEAAKATLKASKDDLAKREKNNEPPPPPKDANGKTTFSVALDKEPPHSYRWAEMGKQSLVNHQLDTASLKEERNRELKEKVETCLKTGEPFELPSRSLCYVRTITAWEKRSKQDRDLGKEREFFLLLREPLAGQAITGDGFTNVSSTKDSRSLPAIDFTFNDEMGNRFYELTSRNKPSSADESGFARQIAIVFDDVVTSAPVLRSPIRSHGQITGDFTPVEVDHMIRILRAGALSARLKLTKSNKIEAKK